MPRHGEESEVRAVEEQLAYIVHPTTRLDELRSIDSGPRPTQRTALEISEAYLDAWEAAFERELEETGDYARAVHYADTFNQDPTQPHAPPPAPLKPLPPSYREY